MMKQDNTQYLQNIFAHTLQPSGHVIHKQESTIELAKKCLINDIINDKSVISVFSLGLLNYNRINSNNLIIEILCN